MNKLWLVKVYSLSLNQRARFLITKGVFSGGDSLAAATALEHVGGDYRTESVMFICMTENDVFEEI